jgi:gluconolactonase
MNVYSDQFHKLRLVLILILCLSATLVLSEAQGASGPGDPQGLLPPTVVEGAGLTVVYQDERFFEGPSWDTATGKLYFTAFAKKNQQVLRLDAPGSASVWMDETQGINGTYFSRNGRLLAAQAFGHNLLSIKIGKDGPEDIKSLTNNFDGIPYIQPNDVAESPTTGAVYYTDPNFKGRTRSAVYCLTPNGTVRRVIENLKTPNGVEVSNDGKTLFVSVLSNPSERQRKPGRSENIL